MGIKIRPKALPKHRTSRKHLGILTILITCLLVGLPPYFVRADNLDSLSKSIEVKTMRRPSNYDLLNHPELPAGSQLRKVFDKYAGGGMPLLDWLAITNTGLSLVEKKQSVDRNLIFTGAQADLRTGNGTKLSILVLVPHPAFADACANGMYDHFAQLRPPKLKIGYSEESVFRDFRATLYEHLSDACSLLLVEPSRKAHINLVVNDCKKERKLLFDFAEKLDFDRFVRNLNS